MLNWNLLLPELLLISLAIIIILVDLFLAKGKKHWLVLLAWIGSMMVAAAVWLVPEGNFQEAFMVDYFSRVMKTIIIAALWLLLMLLKDFEQVWKRPVGELITLVLSSVAGMMCLVSSQELILMIVALELTTFPLILLTAYQPQNSLSAEAGIKYLLMAALGTAVLLFGLSLIIAVAGVTSLAGIAKMMSDQQQSPLLLAGVLFVLAGVGFKIAIVPFHMWAPDAYEGAPTPVTAFLSATGKIAGFAMAVRLFITAFPALHSSWTLVFAVLSAVTMLLGNFAAIPQTNIKRLLAYSSIAQAGYMLMGLLANHPDGLASLIYYLLAYMITTIGAFSVVIAIERGSGRTDLNAYRGLAKRAPRWALVMILALLSLAGIPPLAGFTAKFYLFTAAYGQGYGWLVLLGVLNSALSLYYYLKVIRLMYIEEPEADAPAVLLKPHAGLIATMIISVIGILLIGILPNQFITMAKQAVAGWF